FSHVSARTGHVNRSHLRSSSETPAQDGGRGCSLTPRQKPATLRLKRPGCCCRSPEAQNESLPPICHHLGRCADVALSKLPSGRLLSIVAESRFARLNKLKNSNRIWKLTLSVIRVSL